MKQWLRISVSCDQPQYAEELLFAMGATSVSLVDNQDDAILEPPIGTTPLWPDTRAVALFDREYAAADIIESLRRELPSAAVMEDRLDDQDWIKSWSEQCEPLRFGERLWVCPREKAVHESGAVTVLLDPGLAFGTGTHPSTALCLEWLSRTRLDGKRVIDFGCGSGILGIAALKLGAAHCIAYDIDPQAVIATRNNATDNAVADRMQVIEADEPFPVQAADLVLANILARPLVELAPTLGACLAPAADIVLAGLLRRQADEVKQAYAGHCQFESDAQQDDWVRVHGRRKPS